MASVEQNDKGRHFLVGVFVVAFVAHLWLVFFNLHVPFLSGHEFRQSQTALITYYIDKQNNFSPLYEQPIFGKPWVSFILEFPLYQWSVVGLSRSTGWPHFLSARVISIACFLLSLPALYLALRRLGLDWRRTLLVLAFVVLCPVYIFYTRAFLIDSMAAMFAAWFFAGFVQTMDRRSYVWLAVTLVAGAGAALVKNVLLAVWLIPAASYGAWMLWRDIRAGEGWARPLRTIGWGLATVSVPLGVLKWWIALTDPLKEQNPSTTIFTSTALSQGNWGLFSFSGLFSRELWQTLLARWNEAILPPWLLLGLLALGLILLPRHRWKIAGLAAVFFATQCLFPYAYAWQDYYYYSCAVFVIGAIGLGAVGLWDSRLPRWVSAVLILLMLGAEFRTYWGFYRPQQAVFALGRHSFTDNIKDITPENGIIVIAGYDWASMIPYYSERRALMIRHGLEDDTEYLAKAFKTIADENVHTLIVGPTVRKNQAFLQFATRTLDMDPVPIFSNSWGDVFVSRFYVAKVLGMVSGAHNRFAPDTTFPDRTDFGRHRMRVPPEEAKGAFATITPCPTEVDFEFGVSAPNYAGGQVLSAHTDSLMWITPPAKAQHIEMEYGIVNEAWDNPGNKTNGIEFVIYVEDSTTARPTAIFRRVLDPMNQVQDRGTQIAKVDYTPKPGERLCFAALSNGSKAFDWGYWKRITVR